MSDSADIQQELQALRRDYAARLPGRAAEIEARSAALRGRWERPEAEELRRLAHNLAGSGASYGFPAVSQGARQVERALDAALAAPPTGATFDAIADAVRGLAAAVQAAQPD